MPGTCPKSHVASGWIGFEMGTSSRWHHERVPHLSPCLNPAPSAPAPTGGQRTPPPPSTRGGFPPQKANKYVHPEVPTHTPPTPFALLWQCEWRPVPPYRHTVRPRTFTLAHTRRRAAGEATGGAPTRGRGGTWGPAPLPQTKGTVGQGCFEQPDTTGGGGCHTPRPPPPQPTHPTAPSLPPPLKGFGQPYLPAFGWCNNLFGALGAFTDSASLGTGGGRGGLAGPPLPGRKKSRAVGHCPRVLRCRCAGVSLSTSSPGVLRKRVLGWKGWTCGAQGCDVKPPQPLLPWQSVGCAVVRCGGGCAVRVGLGLYVGGGEGGRGMILYCVMANGRRAWPVCGSSTGTVPVQAIGSAVKEVLQLPQH